jgi:cytochrome c peroxidase
MTQADRDIVDRIYVNYGKALAAYTRRLVSRNAPLDRFLAGDDSAITPAAKRGLHTFIAHCVSCHSGPMLTDDDFHALGVPQTGTNVPAVDNGRFQDVPALLASRFNSDSVFSDNRTTGRLAGLAQVDTQKGQFRTKSLRGIGASRPYMHAGQLPTLRDVVAFYNDGGAAVPDGVTKDPLVMPLGLDKSQENDLVELLLMLDGDPVPPTWLADLSK